MSTKHSQAIKRNRPYTQILPKLKASVPIIALGMGLTAVALNAWARTCVVDISGSISYSNSSDTICGLYNSGAVVVTNLSNSGSISGGYTGIANVGTIGTLTNSGTISGGHKGIVNDGGTISTLTNSGRSRVDPAESITSSQLAH